MSATDEVFSISELREAMLELLTAKDLARAQQVCNDWKATIIASNHCNRTLFLTPSPATDALVYRQQLPTGEWEAFLTGSSNFGQPNAYPILRVHPAFSRNVYDRSCKTEFRFTFKLWQVLHRDAGGYFQSAFLTQPLCSSALVVLPFFRDGRLGDHRLTTLEQADGIRIRDLALHIARFLQSKDRLVSRLSRRAWKAEVRVCVKRHVKEHPDQVRWARRVGEDPTIKRARQLAERRSFDEGIRDLHPWAQSRALKERKAEIRKEKEATRAEEE